MTTEEAIKFGFMIGYDFGFDDAAHTTDVDSVHHKPKDAWERYHRMMRNNRITETGWVINDVEQEYRENQKPVIDKESHK